MGERHSRIKRYDRSRRVQANGPGSDPHTPSQLDAQRRGRINAGRRRLGCGRIRMPPRDPVPCYLAGAFSVNARLLLPSTIFSNTAWRSVTCSSQRDVRTNPYFPVPSTSSRKPSHAGQSVNTKLREKLVGPLDHTRAANRENGPHFQPPPRAPRIAWATHARAVFDIGLQPRCGRGAATNPQRAEPRLPLGARTFTVEPRCQRSDGRPVSRTATHSRPAVVGGRQVDAGACRGFRTAA